MSVNNTSNEDQVEEMNLDEVSVDDFIKELEEKEKDLDISSDLVIEVGESEVEHDNIRDSFVQESAVETELANQALTDEFPPLVGNEEDISSEADTKKISELTEEIKELKETLSRRQKDFDNYRKRTERERSETFRSVIGSLAEQILPVMDNLIRALDAFSEVDTDAEQQDMKTFHEGIILVNQQLNGVLLKMGVEQIPSVGKPFDPHFHEAVSSEITDKVAPNMIIEEILRGYRVDDKVIRPSMVKVSIADSSPKNSPEKDDLPELELD